MADRQTTGGYPKIATVIAADLPLAGQLAPGDWIHVRAVCATGRARRAAAARTASGRAGRMTALADALRAAFGDRRPGAAATGAVHDLQGRRPGRPARDRRPADELCAGRRASRGPRACRSPSSAAARIFSSRMPGVRGLVIRVRGGEVRQVAPDGIRADAGVTINGLVRWTITHGLAGLEAWAGTPGTVGGAIYRQRAFPGAQHQRFRRRGPPARIATARSRTCRRRRMEFAYDYSRLHRTGEIVLVGRFPGRPPASPSSCAPSRASRWPIESAPSRSRSPSAGCIFQNPDPARDPRAGGHSVVGRSAGRSRRTQRRARRRRAGVADARNFIVNEGRATAADVRALIDRCKHEVCGSTASGCAKRLCARIRAVRRPAREAAED